MATRDSFEVCSSFGCSTYIIELRDTTDNGDGTMDFTFFVDIDGSGLIDTTELEAFMDNESIGFLFQGDKPAADIRTYTIDVEDGAFMEFEYRTQNVDEGPAVVDFQVPDPGGDITVDSCEYTGPESIRSFEPSTLSGSVTMTSPFFSGFDVQIQVLVSSVSVGSVSVVVPGKQTTTFDFEVDLERPDQVDGIPEDTSVDFDLEIRSTVYSCGSFTITGPQVTIPKDSITLTPTEDLTSASVTFDIINEEDIGVETDVNVHLTRLDTVEVIHDQTTTGFVLTASGQTSFEENVPLPDISINESIDFELCATEAGAKVVS